MKLIPFVFLFALSAQAEVPVSQLRILSETSHGQAAGERHELNLDQVFEQAGLPAIDASVTDAPTVPGTYPQSYTSSSYPQSYTSSSYPQSYTSSSYPESYTSTSYPQSYTSTSYPQSYTSSSYPQSYTSSNYPQSYTAGGQAAAISASIQAQRYENLPMPQLAQ